MRRIARVLSALISAVVVLAIATSASTLMTGGLPALLRRLGILLLALPFGLAAVVLGPSKHRWEWLALRANQVLAFLAALVIAWTDVTPGQQAGIPALLLMSAALNWASMVDSVRAKSVILGGFGVWAIVSLVVGAMIDDDSKRGLMALLAGVNTFLLYMAGAAAVSAVIGLRQAAKTTGARAVATTAVIAILLGFVALHMGTSMHVAPPPSDIPDTNPSQGIHDSRPSADSAIRQAIDTGSSVIIAQTSTQPANGTSEADITAELVGRWATALGKQAEENARQACFANGGGERLCTHATTGTETHEVIQKNGHKVALIHTTLYTNGTVRGRTLRIFAIRSDALVSVACVRMGDIPLAPTMTPCAEEILKSLNVDFR